MNRRRLSIACIAFVCLVSIGPNLSAQQRGRSYSNQSVPSPREILGFTPGDDRNIADWSQITRYFERLDQASDRVLVQTIGQSTLKRPMIVAFISARENIQALKKYQDIQQQLADPRRLNITGANKSVIERLFVTGKTVVAISCSIHSTEIVASQMSMQLAFDLATADDPETREILQNTILILVPSPNPDGIDIVASWYRKTLGTPFEGHEPPELYHSYAGHDDNRDWFMLNLVESQAITRLFWKEWFPEIVYDVHQQGSNGSRLFIPPFFDPPNPNIDPLLLRQVGLIGHKVAADLQSAGFKGVLTNALYDTWWHGGFRTAPYFHNSIGILSEAASARLMTPTNVTTDQLRRSSTRGMRSATESTTNFPDPWPGGEWHPRDILKMELIAARSVLTIAAKFRTDYLRNFYALNLKDCQEDSNSQGPLAYLIPAGQGHDEAVAKLVSVLIEQGVEVFRLDNELHATYGPQHLQRTSAATEKLGTYQVLNEIKHTLSEVPAGSYIVYLAQPQRSNVKTLFEPQVYPNRLIAGGEAERPYDVAGWTLPLQLGVDAPVVTAIKETPSERKLTLLKTSDEVRKDLALPLRQDGQSPIKNPLRLSVRVGIYRGSTGNMDEGWTRYIFDTFNVPYKSLSDRDVRTGSLESKFDALILPSQRSREIIEGNAPGTMPQEYVGGIGSGGVNNLKSFVINGGTLVCFDAGCELPIKEFGLPLRNVLEGARSSDFYCPGSILSLDVSHDPLSAGVSDKVPAYFINSAAYSTISDTVHVVARYSAQDILLSGWLLGDEKLKGQAALAEVKLGQGRVVIFAFRPQHRGQTWATLPFLWNALSTSKK